jgi:hypothetical protein
MSLKIKRYHTLVLGLLALVIILVLGIGGLPISAYSIR